jgi:predicted nucleotidyltransferase
MIKIAKNSIPRMDEVRGVLKAHGVLKAGLFGSYARGEAKKGSDIDMLVKLKSDKSLLDLAGLEMELEKVLGTKVDLLTYDSINLHLRRKILKEEVEIL